jgi:hypothetical protein
LACRASSARSFTISSITSSHVTGS